MKFQGKSQKSKLIITITICLNKVCFKSNILKFFSNTKLMQDIKQETKVYTIFCREFFTLSFFEIDICHHYCVRHYSLNITRELLSTSCWIILFFCQNQFNFNGAESSSSNLNPINLSCFKIFFGHCILNDFNWNGQNQNFSKLKHFLEKLLLYNV